MKKILLSLLLLFFIDFPSKAEERVFYCYSPGHKAVIEETTRENYSNLLNRCEDRLTGYKGFDYEIPKNIYDKFNNIVEARRTLFNSRYDAGDFTAKGLFSSKNDYNKMRDFNYQTEQILTDFIFNSKLEVEEYNRNREKIVKQEVENRKKLEVELKRKKDLERVDKLNKDFSKFCRQFSKGSEQLLNCLLKQEAQEAKVKEAEAKKLAAEQEKQKKIADAEQAKKKAAEAKIQEEQLKMSKMSPDDRRAFTCNEKFGFRKGSDKFKDCIFELYKAETELEKLELQKQVAKANADAARANAEAARAGAERQERLALAQTEAAKMQAYAAQQQAIAANTADSLALIESGLRMMSPQRPAVAPMRTCTYNRNFMNCF